MVYRPIFFGSASGNMEETSTSRVTMGHKKDGRHGHCARSRLDVLDVDPAARGIYGIYIWNIYIIHIVIYMEYMDLPFLVICYIAIEKLP